MKSLTKQTNEISYIDKFFNFIDEMTNFVSDEGINQILIKKELFEEVSIYIKNNELYNQEYIDCEGKVKIKGFLEYKSIRINFGFDTDMKDVMFIEKENSRILIVIYY